MKSSILGDKIHYHRADDPQVNSEHLADLLPAEPGPALDRRAITSFLTFRFPIGNLTMFDNYRQVPCGQGFTAVSSP